MLKRRETKVDFDIHMLKRRETKVAKIVLAYLPDNLKSMKLFTY